jgi:GNAT superfamily N-acetyltransferase
MTVNGIEYSERRDLPLEQIVLLYKANSWSSAAKAELLQNALHNSHALVSAWKGHALVGLGNAISDGYLVVYYPHLIVHPDFQAVGIGTEIMRRLMLKYQGFHQHMLVADGNAVGFYKKCGFTHAGKTESMWIYSGEDH